MKHNQHIPAPAALILSILQLQLLTSPLYAAVPLRWTVETSRVQPATFEAYQGETLEFAAALQSNGKPLAAPAEYSFYWQTNGMGSAWWSAQCVSPSAPTNVLFATWSPFNDVGARVYTCFIGAPGTIYHAAFQLRLRPSPGTVPNALPLPTPTIDFARVTVTNAPWATPEDMPDGSARPLPKYLHALDFDDSYPAEAAEYYRIRGTGEVGGCSAVREGGFLYRNFDFPFDDRAEFVVRMSSGPGRFASVGVAQVGTNLTERMVTSGSPEYSARYKWLPGATVDGINEHGVVAEINVVNGDPQTSGWHNAGDLHPLAAVRWALDNAKTAEDAATNLAARVAFPKGWTQNIHYMIADERETYIVENGTATNVTGRAVMTNFPLLPTPTYGAGWERYMLLQHSSANITNAWFTRAYSPGTEWISEFGSETLMATSKVLWAQKPKEAHRRETFAGYSWWQTVHTSVYDITNRVLRIAVQETDDWYTFQVPAGGSADAYTKAETDGMLAAKLDAAFGRGSAGWSMVSGKENFEIGGRGTMRLQFPDVYVNGAVDAEEVTCGDGHRLSAKADRATTLAGYGIADAYTKAASDDRYYIVGRPVDFAGELDSAYGAVRYSYERSRWVLSDPERPAGDPIATVSDIPSSYGWSSITGRPTTLSGYGVSASDALLAGKLDASGGEITGPITTGGSAFPVSLTGAADGYGAGGLFWSWHDTALCQNAGNGLLTVFYGSSQIQFPETGSDETVAYVSDISARLNTYVDGETGVEYVGKFYDGSLYYVPTGNVYPPNN